MSELTEGDMYYNFKNYTMCWPQLKRAGRSNQDFVGSTGLCCKNTWPQLQDSAPSPPLPPPPALLSYGSCCGKKWCGFSGRLVPATGNVYNFTEQLFYLYFCEVVNCYFHCFYNFLTHILHFAPPHISQCGRPTDLGGWSSFKREFLSARPSALPSAVVCSG